MICTNCHQEVPDTANACGYCGHHLKSTVPLASTPTEPPLSPKPAAQRVAVQPASPLKGMPTWVWMLGGGGMVAILIFVFALIFGKSLFVPSPLPTDVVHTTTPPAPTELQPESFIPTNTSAITLPPNTPEPTSAPPIGGGTGWIAFSQLGPNGDLDIYKVYYDGSGLQRMTDFSGDEISGWWSIDGSKLSFTSYDMEAYSYWLSDKDLTLEVFDQDLGYREVWDQMKSYENGVYLDQAAPSGADYLNIYLRYLATNSSGGGYDVLTSNEARDITPVFSPDGTQIAFTSDRGRGRDQYQIYLMTSGGENERPITSGDGTYFSPSYSPDGKWIAFLGMENGRSYIFVTGEDGSQMSRVIEVEIDQEDFFWRRPVFQP